jgi:hypothetical protein
MPDLYRVAALTAVPRRYEAQRATMPEPWRYSWAALVRLADGATAEALLTHAESRSPLDLDKIPAERVLVRPT